MDELTGNHGEVRIKNQSGKEAQYDAGIKMISENNYPGSRCVNGERRKINIKSEGPTRQKHRPKIADVLPTPLRL